jgi:hypothetical protein
LYAQKGDTLCPEKEDFLEEQIEFMTEKADKELDFSDLLDDLASTSENPLDINHASEEELMGLMILNAWQVQNLIKYRETYGSLLSIYELQCIEGFTVELIQQILPYITVSVQEKIKITPKNVIRNSKNQLIIRYVRILENRYGYRDLPDSIWIQQPNEKYVGSADYLYLRYGYKYRNLFRLGFTAEKDAGEILINKNIPDTIINGSGNSYKQGFDFLSGFVYASNLGFLKKVIVGDYHLQFGQGLTMWSGLAFGKSAEAVMIKRYPAGIKPNTATNENIFMRGAAFTVQLSRLEITGYYSNHKIDANIKDVDISNQNVISVTSLLESGYHRTFNELIDKRSVREIIYGGNISFRNNWIKTGVTVSLTSLDADLIHMERPDNTFGFKGNKLSNYGFNFDIKVPGKISLFGEIAANNIQNPAIISGLISQPVPDFTFSFLYRYYPGNYHNFHNNAFSEGSNSVNETGYYFGLAFNIFKKIHISSYADFYRFPWLKHRIDAPSVGQEYMVQGYFPITPYLDIYIRYRDENNCINEPLCENYFDHLASRRKKSVRFNISCEVSPVFRLRYRVEYTSLRINNYNNLNLNNNPGGFIIYQDMIYKPLKKSYQVNMRIALFDTDHYNARIYTYEHDVLYAYSVLPYYGQGMRYYLMLKLKVMKFCDLWIRFAQTYYSDRQVIGTGLDMIDGNTRSEIKIQMRIKF